MMSDTQKEQIKRFLRIYFDDLPEWKFELMVQKIEQVAGLETVCVPDE